MPLTTYTDIQFWLLLIPILAAAIVSVVNAIRLKQVPAIVTKLDEVHAVVNGNLAQEREMRLKIQSELEVYKAMLTAKQLEIDIAEKVRIALAITASDLSLAHTVTSTPKVITP